ncbi:MAG: hypothetical protein HC852_05450 [Acaryochloridaceae cyanobacterium RU_4_10]|nr:hypothetical protein [Acaryochloridaceae cyanobacterium RU_4_10]
MNAILDHRTESQQCICALNEHFRGLSQRATVERLVEVLRDADALLKVSHSLFGTIRGTLEGQHDPKEIAKMVELTYNAQRIIDGYEDKITRAWLGD